MMRSVIWHTTTGNHVTLHVITWHGMAGMAGMAYAAVTIVIILAPLGQS